jgi:hypothetical protein
MKYQNLSLEKIANKYQQNIERQLTNFESFLVWSHSFLSFRFTHVELIN